jgi:long-chain acyl-CoA synthetase
MYPGKYARQHADRPAFIMASSGESLTYAALEARSNRLAHLLRAQGLKRLDHYAVFMENNRYFIESCVAGERSGLYFTCINAYLTAEEMAYIVNNCEAKVLITSAEKLAVARQALADCPNVRLCLVAGGGAGLAGQVVGAAQLVDLDEAVAGQPDTPIADEWLGTAMLYSSGTTGKPKGVLRPLPDNPPSQPLPLFDFLSALWRCEEGMTYLSPAPLYHAAPLSNVSLAIRHGGTVIIMENFDPQQYLALIPKHRVTHTQLVPTMFSRLLKLPPADRAAADLSTLKIAGPRRRALPGPGEGADHRVVGPHHPRVLRRHRGHGFHRLRHARMAGSSRHRGQGAARRHPYLRRADAAGGQGPNRRDLVQDGIAFHLLQRSGAALRSLDRPTAR